MQKLMMAVVGLWVGAAIWLAATPAVAFSAADSAVMQQPASPVTATVNTGGVRLRVRSGPGTSYPIVTRLTNGQMRRAFASVTFVPLCLVSVPTWTPAE